MRLLVYSTVELVRLLAGYPQVEFTCVTSRQHVGVGMAVSAIDNLAKGAAGQSVQNMKMLLPMEKTTGLQALPFFP